MGALVRNDAPSKPPLHSAKCRSLMALNPVASAPPPFCISVFLRVSKLMTSRPQLCTAVSNQWDILRDWEKCVHISQLCIDTFCAPSDSELRMRRTVSSAKSRLSTPARHCWAPNAKGPLINAAPMSGYHHTEIVRRLECSRCTLRYAYIHLGHPFPFPTI